MKSIATGNPHLRTAAARKAGIERNVASSSAIEGVSNTVFRSAATGRFVELKGTTRTVVVKSGLPRKK